MARPWDYFDGVSSEDHLICGGGGCLYLSTTHYFLLKSGLGAGTNNYAELLALKLLLLFVVEKGCKTLQVFGDSMLIINWENGVQRCHISRLVPIYEEVLRIINVFDSISFTHLYREQNQLADRLSKEASQLEYGRWYIEEQSAVGIHGFYHRPFHEVSDFLKNICSSERYFWCIFFVKFCMVYRLIDSQSVKLLFLWTMYKLNDSWGHWM
jgi:ribonuclease HI